MIEDTSLQFSQIPNTNFTYTPQISRFMQALEYNMKARAGINPSVSSEDIAVQRNLEYEEDNLAATEKNLTRIDHSNPETMKSLLQSYRAYGSLLKSNPATAVIESFTDADIADKIVSDDVYRINATNTDQDYPVYMTRGAIFESELLNNLENDNPSLYSYVRRFGAPVGLSIAGNLVKGPIGALVTHGAVAAYDVARLGTSIKNTQKRYHDWRNRLLDDKTLTYDQFLEESKKLFLDLQKNVPDEYRYEIYKALQEGPDPFADMGNSFTGLGTDVGIIKPASGVVKGGYEAAKKAVKGVSEGVSKSKNVQKLQYNEDLAEKIKNFATNKTDEAVVEDMVNTKAAVNMPEDASPELQETVKGIAAEQNSDKNLLQNVNNDSYRYDLKISQEDIDVHNALTSGENIRIAEEEAFNKRQAALRKREVAVQRGEIRLGTDETTKTTTIISGKGADGKQPYTWEEIQDWLKSEQGRRYPVYYHNTEFGEIPFEPDKAPEYVNITTASRERWEDLRYNYDRKAGTGEGGQAHGGGGYASVSDNPFEPSREGYRYNFTNESDPSTKIKDQLTKFYIDESLMKKGFFEFDKDEKILKDFVDDIKNEWMFDKYSEAMTKLGYFKDNAYPSDFKELRKIMNILNISDRDVFYGVVGKTGMNTEDAIRNFTKGKFEYDLPSIEWPEASSKISTYDAVDDLIKEYKNIRKEYGLSDEDFRKSIERLDSPGGNEKLLEDVESFLNHLTSAINNVADKRMFNTFVNALKNNKIDVITFAPLYSHPIKNWEKYPELYLYHDDARGVFPMSYFFHGNGIEKRSAITEKAMDSIEEDIIKSIRKDPDKFFEFRGEETPETIAEDLIRAIERKQFRSNWKGWENLQKTYLYNALEETDRPKYFRDWQSKYYTSKGILGTVHFGGGSPGENVVIHDRNAFNKISKEEYNVGKDEFQYLHNNGHGYVSAGDGVGFFRVERHSAPNAKPMLIKNGKIVDKGE